MEQNIENKKELALKLDVKYNQIVYLVYVKKIENCYNEFTIKKKNGQERVISAPNESLKRVQRKIANFLANKIEDNTLNIISHGFSKNKSIKTNGFPHRNKRYLLNVDLEDFFDSIHFGRVRGFFKTNKNFKFSDEEATLIAQLTCYKKKLPQGAPTSPVISNLIAGILDYRILKICKKYKLVYTRYVDDMTFSTNNKEFENEYSNFLIELDKVVKRTGFMINTNKTHFQKYNERQTVTGLTVNKKLNVKKEYYKKTRAMAYNLYKTGSYNISNGIEGTINQLEGRFVFINDLVKYNNGLEEKSSLMLNSLEHKKNLLYTQEKVYRLKPESAGKEFKFLENLDKFTIREKDYQKFLFFKYFLANKKIAVLTEGKTDSRYIKAALRKYYKEYPNLITKKIVNGKEKYDYNINFVQRTKRLSYFFGYLEDGGGGNFEQLLNYFLDENNHRFRNYMKYFESINDSAPAKPVIFLVDNEENEKKPLMKIINLLAKVKFNNQNNDKPKEKKEKIKNDIMKKIKTFYLYNIERNTFLMALPSEKLKGESDIEIENLLDIDSINKEFVQKECNGKIFVVGKDERTEERIDKEIFSKTVLKNYKSINFEQFIPLLDLIDGLSGNYREYIDVLNKERKD